MADAACTSATARSSTARSPTSPTSSNKRQAGAVYAAEFLRDFTDGLPWCHVNIAGTGMVGGAGTGFGVRLILEVAERLAARRAAAARRRR